MCIQYLIAVCFVLCALADNAMSQTAPRPGVPKAKPDETWSMPDRNRVNEGTVTVITAPAGGATSVFGSDMSRVLDDDATVRVLTVLGKGPVRNVIDVLHLKSIDMGIVTTDVPEFYRLQYKIPDITSRMRFIAMLYLNEVHVVARTSIQSIFDLEGKKVIAPTDVGYYAARVIFSRLNIKPAWIETQLDDARSIQKIADGEGDAYIGSTGKPFQLLRSIIKNEDRSLHLVPIPYDPRLEDLYLPTTLSSEEYPNLLPAGQRIDTIAAIQLLVTLNWPETSERYNRVARFVDAFFSKINEFRKPPRHPKWKEASITASIPGWQRFKPADEWLVAHDMTPERVRFEKFLADKQVPGAFDPSMREALFRRFLKWKQNNPSP
ncbi:MAG TPA: TAXI family TRAP transporter solute-binding subunit [Hyphomicrobiaceae bacterium]|jgi:TRAP-type uncharacterized transport system substrate-binding protein|nr:TAXI family TRAP transporter solute-binding subunit [Hyphomicrobiaceae bacterium]